MPRRHDRARKERRKLRLAAEREALLAPCPQTEGEPTPPMRPRTLTLGVKGGWSMDFVTSGVPVPFDPEAQEPPPLEALTLDAMLAPSDKPAGES